MEDIDIETQVPISTLGTGGGTDHNDPAIRPRPIFRWEGILSDLRRPFGRRSICPFGEQSWRVGELGVADRITVAHRRTSLCQFLTLFRGAVSLSWIDAFPRWLRHDRVGVSRKRSRPCFALAQFSPLPLDNFLDCSLPPFCCYCVIASLEEQLLLLGYFNISFTWAEMKQKRDPPFFNQYAFLPSRLLSRSSFAIAPRASCSTLSRLSLLTELSPRLTASASRSTSASRSRRRSRGEEARSLRARLRFSRNILSSPERISDKKL